MTFVDSGYLIALVDRADQLHDRSLKWAGFLVDDLITTSLVWVELFNHCTAQPLRDSAHRFREALDAQTRFKAIHVDEKLMQAGFALHRGRPDKTWSLTDCISFTVMTDRGIKRALAYDHHFEQAGFEALLRRDPP